MCLAAADDVTRQRCVRIIEAASAGGASSSLPDIASSAALTPGLFMMQSLPAVNAVLAALGRPAVINLDLSSLKTSGFDFSTARAAGFDLKSLKAAGFDAAAFKSAGCDCVDLKMAGFTTKELKTQGFGFSAVRAAGFDLRSLRECGFDIEAFRTAGCDWAAIREAEFSMEEAKAAGCDPKNARLAGYSFISLEYVGFVDLAAINFRCNPIILATAALTGRILVRSKIDPNLALVFQILNPHISLNIRIETNFSFFIFRNFKTFEATHYFENLMTLNNPVTPAPQRDGSNLYMTLHMHKVDDRCVVQDCDWPLPAPEGWQVADGNDNDIRVCGAHPWQSLYLLCKGGYRIGTALCPDSRWIGKCSDCRQKLNNLQPMSRAFGTRMWQSVSLSL